MLARLLPKDGGDPIEIARDVTVVGRQGKLCDVKLEHASVSKLHCLITRTYGLPFFRDLASTNGTRVNGQRVTRGALLPNDELAFGRVRFEVHLGPGETNHDDSDMGVSMSSGTDEFEAIDLDV